MELHVFSRFSALFQEHFKKFHMNDMTHVNNIPINKIGVGLNQLDLILKPLFLGDIISHVNNNIDFSEINKDVLKTMYSKLAASIKK